MLSQSMAMPRVMLNSNRHRGFRNTMVLGLELQLPQPLQILYYMYVSTETRVEAVTGRDLFDSAVDDSPRNNPLPPVSRVRRLNSASSNLTPNFAPFIHLADSNLTLNSPPLPTRPALIFVHLTLLPSFTL